MKIYDDFRLYSENISKNYFFKLLRWIVIQFSLMLFLDIKNIPSNYLLYNYLSISCVIVVVFIIITIFFENHFQDVLKYISLNLIDCLLLSQVFSITFYLIIYSSFYPIEPYKLPVGMIAILVGVGILIYRGRRFINSKKNNDNEQSRLIDLKDIYENNFDTDDTILLNEKDVSYDLLNRKHVINQLTKAIYTSRSNSGFVISLEGKWGGGKTTILNISKKELKKYENIYIVDEFDPWLYSGQESLFRGMFDMILKHTGIRYNHSSIKYYFESILEGVLSTQKSGKILKNILNQKDSIAELKNKINNYLKLCGKRFIFIIDNLDRAENENIILLFKLVGNVFDFEKITYVLSYDSEKVENIFKNKSIDSQFLKKVIQMSISVPKIDKNTQKLLFTKCLENLNARFDANIEKSDYEHLASFMCVLGIDIRDFKRFINSVFSITLTENYLNKKDMLFIEFIRFYNKELYDSIYKNRNYFISHDRNILLGEIEYLVSENYLEKDFDKKANDIFEKIFSNQNSNYKDILSKIFPYVKLYKEHINSSNSSSLNLRTAGMIDIGTISICSAKYIDLYFTKSDNPYLDSANQVKGIIDDLNSGKDFFVKNDEFVNKLNKMDISFHKETFEVFQLYISKINNDAIFDLIKILFENIYKIDNSEQFLSLNSRRRVLIIISKFLNEITPNEFTEFMTIMKIQYDKIEIINEILYKLQKDNTENEFNRFNIMQSTFKEMGEYVIANSLNLFDNSFYKEKNIWGLFRLYKDNIVELKGYIQKVLNKENVFRLLNDLIKIVTSSTGEIMYYVDIEYINYFTSENEIDTILSNVEQISEDQQFILDVYNKFKSKTNDDDGKPSITVYEYKKFNKL